MNQEPKKEASACWVETSDGYAPDGAIAAVSTKHFGAAYVARALHNGEWLPGVLIETYGHCLVTSAGEQHRKYEYQVLCNAGETWVHTNANLALPQDIMPIGYTEVDKNLYMGRVALPGGVTVLGKVSSRDRRCYVFHQKSEKCFVEYEILTVPLSVQYAMSKSAIKQAPPPKSQTSAPTAVSHKYKIDNRRGSEVAVANNVVPVVPRVAPATHRGRGRGTTSRLSGRVIAPSYPSRGAQITALPQAVSYPPVDIYSPYIKNPYYSPVHPMYPPAAYPNPLPPNYYPEAKTRASPIPTPQALTPTPRQSKPVVDKGRWVASSKGKVPPGAVIGGKNHRGPIYVGRVKHEAFWIPGKFIPGYGRCYITVEGQEIHSKEYEVLCDGILSWQDMTSAKDIPDTAVLGGKYENSTLYIGRIAHGGSVTVGKVDKTSKKCHVLYGGVEHCYSDYEILVYSADGGASHVPAVVAPLPTPKSNPEEDFKMVVLTTTDKDYISTNKMMQSTIRSHVGRTFSEYKIIKMERVWNKTIWKRFMQCRERVMQENNKDANEKELFHGSTKCEEIVKKGFDERHSRISGMFGAGVYFAEHSSKSDQYAKCVHGAPCTMCPRQMMLCRVILGKISEYTSAQNGLAHAPPGCHSVKGTTAGLNLVYPEYIVYRGEQAFPKILVTYKIVK